MSQKDIQDTISQLPEGSIFPCGGLRDTIFTQGCRWWMDLLLYLQDAASTASTDPQSVLPTTSVSYC